VTSSDGTTPYIFAWDHGPTTESVTGLAAGTYKLVVTDGNGCQDSITQVIDEPVALNITVDGTTNVSCNGGGDGEILVTTTDGTNPYTFNWDNGETTEDISSLSVGSYKLIVTDDNGCQDSVTQSITEPTALNITIDGVTNVSCNGGGDGEILVTTTDGTSPYTFNWNNGETTEDISSLSVGSYKLIVTDNLGCKDSITQAITEPTALNITIDGVTNVSCNGGSNGSIDVTTTDGTSPYTFNWDNGETTEDISSLSIGSYKLIVTDNLGCQDSASYVVNEPGQIFITIDSSTNVSCNGLSDGAVYVTTTGGVPPYTFAWDNGATTEDIIGLVAGTYELIVTDNNGAKDTITHTVTEPVALTITVDGTTNVSCNGGSNASIDVTTTNGTAPYTFSWNNGATTEDISSLTAGTYKLIVTDNNGCVDSISQVITEPVALNITVDGTTNVSCNGGSNGNISVTTTDGTSPYTFNWDNGETTEDISSLSVGSVIVCVIESIQPKLSVTINL
jgi:hypothetical protein